MLHAVPALALEKVGIGSHHGSIHGKRLALDQASLDTATYDLLEHFSEHSGLAKASVPIRGEGQVVGNLGIEVQLREPPISPVHPYFIQQTPLAGNAVHVPDQQYPQQHLGINRWTTGRTVEALQPLAHEAEIDIAVQHPQQVIFWNLLFQAEVVEQRLGPRLLTHHSLCSS